MAEIDYESYETVRILDLSIPFFAIQGVSQRQEWYANNLREAWIRMHYQRFLDIDEKMQREADARIRQENEFQGPYCQTLEQDFTEAEKVCLFSRTASSVISVLKREMDRDYYEEEDDG